MKIKYGDKPDFNWVFISDFEKNENGNYETAINCENCRDYFVDIIFSESAIRQIVDENKNILNEGFTEHTDCQYIYSIEIDLKTKYFENEYLIIEDNDGSKIIVYETNRDGVFTKSYELEEFKKLITFQKL